MTASSHTITVQLFAGAAQAAGSRRVDVLLPTAEIRLGAFAELLANQHPDLATWVRASRFAVGTKFVEHDANLMADSVVAMIPPVSGG